MSGRPVSGCLSQQAARVAWVAHARSIPRLCALPHVFSLPHAVSVLPGILIRVAALVRARGLCESLAFAFRRDFVVPLEGPRGGS